MICGVVMVHASEQSLVLVYANSVLVYWADW